MQSPNRKANSTILLTEDEPAIREVCHRVLASEGFELDKAENGIVAKEMIEKKEYVLYLIDIKMPKLDGKQLYHWLKENHPELANRVIFITGSVMGGDTQEFLDQANRPFLLKPFTPDELIATLGKTLRLS